MPALKRDVAHKLDLAALIRQHMFMYGLSYQTMAPKLGMSEKTLRIRMKDPGSFTLDEINRISHVIKIPAKILAPVISWGFVS